MGNSLDIKCDNSSGEGGDSHLGSPLVNIFFFFLNNSTHIIYNGKFTLFSKIVKGKIHI